MHIVLGYKCRLPTYCIVLITLAQATIKFEGNRANVGPAVLLSDKDICLWNSSMSPFFSEDLQGTWEELMDMG